MSVKMEWKREETTARWTRCVIIAVAVTLHMVIAIGDATPILEHVCWLLSMEKDGIG